MGQMFSIGRTRLRVFATTLYRAGRFVEGVWDVLMLIVLKSFFFDFADRSGRGLHFILEVIFGLAGFRHANSQNVDQDYSLRDVGAEFGLVLSSFS